MTKFMINTVKEYGTFEILENEKHFTFKLTEDGETDFYGARCESSLVTDKSFVALVEEFIKDVDNQMPEKGKEGLLKDFLKKEL